MALNITPESYNTLAQTQLLIKNNFIFINDGFAFDHVEFNSTGAGKHNKITFPVQAAAPVFVDAGDLGLFSLLNATTTKNELNVYKANGVGANFVNVPFTASILSNSVPGPGTAGWSYLPSGLIIQWGKYSANNTLNALITTPSLVPLLPSFPFQIPFPTQCLNVKLTQSTTGSAERGLFYNVHSFTQAGFRIDTYRISTIVAGGPSSEYSYFAIGY